MPLGGAPPLLWRTEEGSWRVGDLDTRGKREKWEDANFPRWTHGPGPQLVPRNVNTVNFPAQFLNFFH